MNRLYETIRKIKGIDYRYWGFGKLSLIIGPKSDPTKIKDENVLRLLIYLDKQEENDLKLYNEDRQKLVKSLSEDYKIRYSELRKENLQTRLRQESIQILEILGNTSAHNVKSVSITLPGHGVRNKNLFAGKELYFYSQNNLPPESGSYSSELKIPHSIASTIKVTEVVTPSTLKKVKKDLKNPPNSTISRIIRPDGVPIRLDFLGSESLATVVEGLEVGYAIVRQLTDGDILMFSEFSSEDYIPKMKGKIFRIKII